WSLRADKQAQMLLMPVAARRQRGAVRGVVNGVKQNVAHEHAFHFVRFAFQAKGRFSYFPTEGSDDGHSERREEPEGCPYRSDWRRDCRRGTPPVQPLT